MMIVGLGDEDLRFIHQPAKRGGMDNPIAIALIRRPEQMRNFRMAAAPGVKENWIFVQGYLRDEMTLTLLFNVLDSL